MQYQISNKFDLSSMAFITCLPEFRRLIINVMYVRKKDIWFRGLL